MEHFFRLSNKGTESIFFIAFARRWQVLRKEMARNRHTQTACLSMLGVCLKCACGIGSRVQKEMKQGSEGDEAGSGGRWSRVEKKNAPGRLVSRPEASNRTARAVQPSAPSRLKSKSSPFFPVQSCDSAAKIQQEEGDCKTPTAYFLAAVFFSLLSLSVCRCGLRVSLNFWEGSVLACASHHILSVGN